jgi:hypothetical protein
MPSENIEQTSMTEKLMAWLRGRWQQMTTPTPPYTGSISTGGTPAPPKSKRSIISR